MDFPFSILEPWLLTPTRNVARSLRKTLRIPKILKRIFPKQTPWRARREDVDPVALTNRNSTGRIVQGIGYRPSGSVIPVAGLAITELEDECERNDTRKSAAGDDLPAGVHP
jgi:hypothetical protein